MSEPISEPISEPTNEPASGPIHPAWARHFDVIGDELLRLTTICGVNLREPGIAERILKDDATVCSKNNPIGFRKLRDLMMATFSSLNKSVDRIGADETKVIVHALMERLDQRRELGGSSGKRPPPASEPA